jgi:hypothetical protein
MVARRSLFDGKENTFREEDYPVPPNSLEIWNPK